MSRKVTKWEESYASGGNVLSMDFRTFSCFLHGGWG